MNKKRITRPHDKQSPAKSKYTELVDIDKNANGGLHNASGIYVQKLLGDPKRKEVLNLIKYQDVGPFKVEGLAPALKSLKEIFSFVNSKYPDLHHRVGHNGMRVVKKIAGKKAKSLHSWGIAIDITIDGIQDVKWNDKTFYGLALIAPIFHEHQWYWGGAFRDQETAKGSQVYWSNEDAMHFEVSQEKLLEWAKAGELGPQAAKVAKTLKPGLKQAGKPIKKDYELRAMQATQVKTSPAEPRVNKVYMKRGDTGLAVQILQLKLKYAGVLPRLEPDQLFGRNTEKALKNFQRKYGLKQSGVVDSQTDEALNALKFSIPAYADLVVHMPDVMARKANRIFGVRKPGY